MFVTPIANTIVTTVANPSGIAATARLTDTIKVSIKILPSILGYALARVNKKIKIHIPITKKLKVLLS